MESKTKRTVCHCQFNLACGENLIVHSLEIASGTSQLRAVFGDKGTALTSNILVHSDQNYLFSITQSSESHNTLLAAVAFRQRQQGPFVEVSQC